MTKAESIEDRTRLRTKKKERRTINHIIRQVTLQDVPTNLKQSLRELEQLKNEIGILVI